MPDILKDSEGRMQKAIEAVKKNFAAIRSGRANPALLDHIQVEYYGSNVPLKQLASVSIPEARALLITPYDKNASANIEKAILTSDLGIHPKNEGGVIRLSLPAPTEERRKELLKIIKKEAEDGKIALRNARRDAIGEKQGTEDEKKIRDKKVQELTDKYCTEIDRLTANKEKEIMEV